VPNDPSNIAGAVLETPGPRARREFAWRIRSPLLVGRLVALLDGVAIATASLVFYSSYVGPNIGWTEDTLVPHLGMTALNIYLIVQAFTIAGLYRLDALIRPSGQLARTAMICIKCTFVLAILTLALNMLGPYSKSWAVVGTLDIILLIWLGRLLAFVAIHDLGVFARRIVVYGNPEHTRRLLRPLREKKQPWNHVLGVFDDSADSPRHVEGYPVLGGSDRMVEFARCLDVDEVLVAIPWDRPEQAEAVMGKLAALPANVHLGPSLVAATYPGSRLSLEYGVPMLNILARPLSGPDAMAKEICDKVLGSLLLVAAAPLLLLIAAAIKLDSYGPALFVQQRYGFNNRLIGVWKFRTMHVEHQDGDGDQLTTQNDPRVTRVGAFLRRTSLDELPQLFNVLAGEMSLVGPRPHALQAKAAGKLYQEAVPHYAARHKVKPGITGWAQVNGWRGETDTEEKIRRRIDHDMYYIENWSLMLDFKILVLTVPAVVSGRNSY
jgi:Undecaprenyl-phosphate glucose phosphotransferase